MLNSLSLQRSKRFELYTYFIVITAVIVFVVLIIVQFSTT